MNLLHELDGLQTIAGLTDHIDPLKLLQQGLEPCADHCMVVHEHDLDRLAAMCLHFSYFPLPTGLRGKTGKARKERADVARKGY
jgi:hypothetical protein